jgi:D-glycero-beta-D-manno-heptose-7-phosphate kinase
LPDLLPRARATEIVGRFTGTPLTVVGDVMLDQFIVGRVDRISPEAPVPVMRFECEHHQVGGAANVAHNVRALGGRVDLVGVIGEDGDADSVRRALRSLGIGQDGLVADGARLTTKKVRLVTNRNQQVARIDYERDDELSHAVAEQLVAMLDRHLPGARAVVVSDYMKGTVTRRVMEHVLRLGARHGVPVLVDPKIPHLEYYAGAALITPNHYEAEVATHTRIRTDEDARTAARLFRDRTRCKAVLITRGEHGMWLLDGDREQQLPTLAREVADVTGAGDTVIAALSLALAAGATRLEAVVIANAAAGVTVGKFGPATLTQEELLHVLNG